ncbi:transglutaminase family protein [Robiginitomaculum antarcticum]|uniref:transglutaminase family protein n=1 Tax=Robiginitomaculum antarcticum TaxID=437507 RepID=UPI00035E7014|nr:transglutaminase family protein [Robiginitomaculum antarcticum]
MQLSVSHTTRYNFETAPAYGLQQLRLTPKTNAGQEVLDWTLDIEGAQTQAIFDDEHRNRTHLISINDGAKEVLITSRGTLDMTDQHGIVGTHGGFTPLWLFLRQTDLTTVGDGVTALAATLPDAPDATAFHALSKEIARRVNYETGQTGATTTAEEALDQGAGVCQDHAHIFISSSRLAGHPARYVSGYLMMNDRVDQDATHAWAEVWIKDLGWTGFDVSNGISPDARYVRVATGLDYNQASPISGITLGGSGETINVNVQVQQ